MHEQARSNDLIENIKNHVRDIPDFPKEGILFKDITPILLNPQLCSEMVDEMANRYRHLNVDAIAAIEARGFLFGILLAQKMQVPFIPLRKSGKLPYKTVAFQYALEYGLATVEMHEDAIQPGMNVLIHDDLLATGGTAAATAALITRQGGDIAGFSFIIQLDFLKGAELLKEYSTYVDSLVIY